MPNKMEVYLCKSKAKHKKWTISIPEKNKTIQFGDSEYADYTTHKDVARKQNYIQRHQARESWSDPLTAGFWSRWLLWNKPTLSGSIADIQRRFKIKVKRSPAGAAAASPQHDSWGICRAALSGRRKRRSRRYSGQRRF